jgi:hypothetical protein
MIRPTEAFHNGLVAIVTANHMPFHQIRMPGPNAASFEVALEKLSSDFR